MSDNKVPSKELISSPASVGGGYTVQFTAPNHVDCVLSIGCIWSPSVPSARDWRRKIDMRRYDHALAAFTKVVAAAMVNIEGGAS
jgi:hypothetical protein